MKYKNSLLRKKLYEWERDTSRKIRTYVKNSSFYYGNRMADSVFEEWDRKAMGLTPVIYNGLTSYRKDKYDLFGYSADPLQDSLKTMSDRIILW